MPIYGLAKELAGEPRRYRLERDGRGLGVFGAGFEVLLYDLTSIYRRNDLIQCQIWLFGRNSA